MKYRTLLIALVLSVIMLASGTTLNAQQGRVEPQNNVVQNTYTYTPVLYQRAPSTSDVRLFPNPARNSATIYINSIKDRDNGEVVIYNIAGMPVYKNLLKTGNNNLNLGSLSNGMYIVKVFTKDRFAYTSQLVVQK